MFSGKSGTTLFRYMKAFGMLNGLAMFVKCELLEKEKISVRQYPCPLLLRKGTTDLKVFVEIFIFGAYDIDPGFTPEVIIDAGANIGLSAVLFANKYPDAKIIAIEPDSGNYRQLIRNTENYKNIIPVLGGIWNRNTKLNTSSGAEWSVMVSDAGVGGEINGFSIDELMKKYNLEEIDILKLDIEGSEAVVFESGYETWLPKVRILIVEIHDYLNKNASKNLFAAISKYNFTCKVMNGMFFFERY